MAEILFSEMDAAKLKIPETLCVLPWIHLSSRALGTPRICCSSNDAAASYRGSVVHNDGTPMNFTRDSFATALNSNYMKNLRKDFLQGKTPIDCMRCAHTERAGARSKRNWEREEWIQRAQVESIIKNSAADGGIEPNILYLDLRMGNRCNLACTHCSSHSSSLWEESLDRFLPGLSPDLLAKLDKKPGEKNWFHAGSAFWDSFAKNLPALQQLNIAGGEPTLMPAYYKILELCIDSGHASGIDLRHNTNGTVFSARLVRLWSEFRSVNLQISMDGIDARGEFLRYPLRWEPFVENLRKFDGLALPGSRRLDFTVSLLNIFHLPDVIEWKLMQDFKTLDAYPHSGGLIGTHLLHVPSPLSIQALPPQAKILVREKFESLFLRLERRFAGNPRFLNHPSGIQRLREILRYMDSADRSQENHLAAEFLDRLDLLRGTHWRSVLPEIAEWIPKN